MRLKNDKIDNPDVDKSDELDDEPVGLVLDQIVRLHYEGGVRADGYHIAMPYAEAGAPLSAGTVVIESHGDERYTITVDWLDNALSPHSITCVWTGVLKSYSYGWN